MDRPSELIRRAKAGRRQRNAQNPKAEAPVPETATPAAVLPIRHGVYSQLMRNHDRLHTRHLG